MLISEMLSQDEYRIASYLKVDFTEKGGISHSDLDLTKEPAAYSASPIETMTHNHVLTLPRVTVEDLSQMPAAGPASIGFYHS